VRTKSDILARAATAALLAAGTLGLAQTAAAEESGWKAGDVVIRAGSAGILPTGGGDVALAGTTVPGGSVDLSNTWTASADVEYFLSPAISLSFNAGIPGKTTVTGTGTLAGVGTAGKIKFGIAAATARYHLDLGRVSPFVGAGVGHFFVFGETDGAVTGLKVNEAWAPVIQGGLDVHLTNQVGLYTHVSYAPVDTSARGSALGAPLTATIKLNPTIVQRGLFYRF